MQVNEILRNVAVMLQLNEILNIVNGKASADKDQQEELDLLISCVNFTNNIIASDYIKITEMVEVDNSTGCVYFENITDKHILDIIKVEDKFNNKIKFSITPDGIKTIKGNVFVKFAYFPNLIFNLNDEITCYKTRLNERVFAYGVAAEYLFIKGNIEDATMWDMRFKNALLSIQGRLRDVQIPKRRWY